MKYMVSWVKNNKIDRLIRVMIRMETCKALRFRNQYVKLVKVELTL